MFYTWDILVEDGTTEAEPKTEILKLTKGAIKGIYIHFLRGCHSVVKIRIFKDESQLVPLNLDEWVTGDGETVPTETYYELISAPYQLKFVGISPTTHYDHKITVRVQVEPLEIAAPWRILADFVTIVKRLLGIG